MKKSENIVVYLLTIIGIIFVFYLQIEAVIKKRSLDRNLEYSRAVIVDFSSGPRMRYYLDYNFFIEEKEYQGSGKYYPASDTLSVGDTITVVYDRTNPDNNRPERDY